MLLVFCCVSVTRCPHLLSSKFYECKWPAPVENRTGFPRFHPAPFPSLLRRLRGFRWYGEAYPSYFWKYPPSPPPTLSFFKANFSMMIDNIVIDVQDSQLLLSFFTANFSIIIDNIMIGVCRIHNYCCHFFNLISVL